jgi:hypothetical protein
MELVPPTEQVFDTAEACLEHTQQYARTHGYAVTIKRSKYTYVNDEKQLQTMYLHCSKGGTYRNRDPELRNRSKATSRLIDCPFQASIRRCNNGQLYVLHISNPEHNYDPIVPIVLPQH